MALIALTACKCIDCIPSSSHAAPKQRPNQHPSSKQRQIIAGFGRAVACGVFEPCFSTFPRHSA
eukprot:6942232-Lingulodinium_polyedra.AAC.1